MLEIVWRDVTYAWRALRRTPGFTAVAVVTLAVGIGANAAIFSVFDAVLLRPLPYRDAERLYVIHETSPRDGRLIPANAFHFREWRRSSQTFEQMALIGGMPVTLHGAGEPATIAAARVSPALFPMLGVQPALGRAFREDEDVEGRERVILLSHEIWTTRFGADPGVIGRTVSLDGDPHEIVGVLPAGFSLPKLSHFYSLEVESDRPQIWRPFAPTARDLRPLNSFNYIALGRVRPGVTPAQVEADINAIQSAMSRELPELAMFRAVVVAVADQIVSRSRTALQLVLATVAMVLVIACVNITNLLLARGARRQREFAIRRAAGAHRLRLMSQMLVESIVLSTIAGAAGVLVGAGLVRLIQLYAPVDVPRIEEASLDLRTLLFTFAVTLASGIVIGLAPAWRATRATASDVLRSWAATAATTGTSARLRSLLVGAEMAASAICVVAGVLLLSSFARLMAAERGFESDGVVTAEFVLLPPQYDAARGVAFMTRLADRVRALPGVNAAGVTDLLPLSGESNSSVVVEGRDVPRPQRPVAHIRMADRGYFEAMGIRPMAGRLPADTATGVAVIGATTAARLWPGQDAIGRRFRHGPDDSPWVEVVAVVNDVRAVSLTQDPPLTIYRPIADFYYGRVALVVKASNAAAVAPAVQRMLREMDPQLAVEGPRLMNEIVTASVAERRFQMNLMLLLAGLAAFLAALGVYGVVSQLVAQRTSEFGVRMALGAEPSRILRFVLGRAMLPVGAGVAIGLVASVGVARFLRSMLFGVSPTDVMPLVTAACLLTAIGLLASAAPAQRATRINPLDALRAE
jgi:predicted permease